MEHLVDARGLTCPAPVLLVKDAVERETENELNVLVDNAASQENVTRFLNFSGYITAVTEQDGIFSINACRDKEHRAEIKSVEKKGEPISETGKILVLITTERLGSGDDQLGDKLMINYIKTLGEMGSALWQLIFVNGGVKLTIQSSAVLAELQEYEESGVTVLACGTCLEHFGITSEKAVGSATNMLDIVTATQVADKVITLG